MNDPVVELPISTVLGTWRPITIAVDFDGTLVEKDVEPLQWRPWAKAFVLGASQAGVQMWLWSCRCTATGEWDDDELFWRTGQVQPALLQSWRLFEEMRRFLVAQGVWHLFLPWTLPGTPLAQHYFDDHADQPNWRVAAAELGVVLAHGNDARPAGQVGGSPGLGVLPGASPAAAVAPGEPSPAPAGLRVQT